MAFAIMLRFYERNYYGNTVEARYDLEKKARCNVKLLAIEKQACVEVLSLLEYSATPTNELEHLSSVFICVYLLF